MCIEKINLFKHQNRNHYLDFSILNFFSSYGFFPSFTESAAAAARKDATSPNDSNVSGNAYASEHDSSASKDDASNSEQVATSFGDMNISVAVSCTYWSIRDYSNFQKVLIFNSFSSK